VSSGNNCTWYEKSAGGALFLGGILATAGLGSAISGGAIAGAIIAAIGLALVLPAYVVYRF